MRPKRTLGEGVMVNLSPSRKTPSFLSLAHHGEGLNDDGQFSMGLHDGGASQSGPNSHSSISSEPPRLWRVAVAHEIGLPVIFLFRFIKGIFGIFHPLINLNTGFNPKDTRIHSQSSKLLKNTL